MTNEKFAEAVRMAHAEEIGFAEFLRHTSSYWDRWAASIMRRYKPYWYDACDVKQELVIAAWYALYQYEPAKGLPISHYVSYVSSKLAKKRTSKAAGYEQHNRQVRVFHEERFDVEKHDVVFESEDLAFVERERLFVDLLSAEGTTRDEKVALRALICGRTVEAAAAGIMSDSGMRLTCRVSTEYEAVAALCASLGNVVKRNGGMQMEALAS